MASRDRLDYVIIDNTDSVTEIELILKHFCDCLRGYTLVLSIRRSSVSVIERAQEKYIEQRVLSMRVLICIRASDAMLTRCL